jgi:hypothetical protein
LGETEMKFLCLLATALVLSACATTPADNKSSSTVHEEKNYRIGSRIPQKDSVGASPTATMDASALSNLPVRPGN